MNFHPFAGNNALTKRTEKLSTSKFYSKCEENGIFLMKESKRRIGVVFNDDVKH